VRDQILNEIRKLAAANGGQPPGRKTFEEATGIRPSAWRGVYWARWGDAVGEAGFNPNAASPTTEDELFCNKLIEACRYYGRVPTAAEFRLYRRIDAGFPADNTFRRRFGGTAEILKWFSEQIKARPEYEDVATMLVAKGVTATSEAKYSLKEGLVYLIKSGIHYKIGRSDELERRVKEIRIALPEAASLVHSIRTDDPAGIEAYWHRRFADKRANGEWFKLTNADVAAFKKRKYQ